MFVIVHVFLGLSLRKKYFLKFKMPLQEELINIIKVNQEEVFSTNIQLPTSEEKQICHK